MALKDFDKALEIEPTYARAYNTRGNSRSALGLFEDALRDYEQVLLAFRSSLTMLTFQIRL